jgi:hypothetical protein
VADEAPARALDEAPEAEAVRRLAGDLALDEGARLICAQARPAPMWRMTSGSEAMARKSGTCSARQLARRSRGVSSRAGP